MAEKVGITQRFLQRKVEEYEALKSEIEALRSEVDKESSKGTRKASLMSQSAEIGLE